mgnify:CR=1 FL=1
MLIKNSDKKNDLFELKKAFEISGKSQILVGKALKKDISNWGAKDLWGDFDLLIGAYKNNLKIIEVPVTYFERTENETKMNSLIFNAARMLYIVLVSYYKLRLKK